MTKMISYSVKNKKVRLYRTFDDTYYTDWIPVKEGLKIIIAERKAAFNKDIEQLKKTFPSGFTDPRTRKIIK